MHTSYFNNYKYVVICMLCDGILKTTMRLVQ